MYSTCAMQSYIPYCARHTIVCAQRATVAGHADLQEQYVNDRDFLLGAATRAGLPEDQAAALLDDPNAMRAEVAHLRAVPPSNCPLQALYSFRVPRV